MDASAFGFFDADAEHGVFEGRNLPHWLQSGTLSFMTWTLRDAMPRQVVEAWCEERDALVQAAGGLANLRLVTSDGCFDVGSKIWTSARGSVP